MSIKKWTKEHGLQNLVPSLEPRVTNNIESGSKLPVTSDSVNNALTEIDNKIDNLTKVGTWKTVTLPYTATQNCLISLFGTINGSAHIAIAINGVIVNEVDMQGTNMDQVVTSFLPKGCTATNLSDGPYTYHWTKILPLGE